MDYPIIGIPCILDENGYIWYYHNGYLYMLDENGEKTGLYSIDTIEACLAFLKENGYI